MKKTIDIPVSVGLDIGISSVGLAVLDAKSGTVLEAMSDIFSEGSNKENINRRSARQNRRLKNRKKTRLRDSKLLLTRLGFISGRDKDTELSFERLAKEKQNVYELRVKGLTERLTKDEIVAVVQHMIKRRGISYDLEDYENEEESKNISNYKGSIEINQKLLRDYTPGQIQLERLNKYGKVRGMIDSGDGKILLNIFPTDSYVKELNQILQTQKQYYSELTKESIDKILNILKRKRDYSKGPGSRKSPTNYGIYKTDGRVLENLYEELIGRDKYFPTEKRAATNTYTAQYFNMLNDLNNLRILNSEEGCLTIDQKKIIVNEILENRATRLDAFKLIRKVTKASKNEITGYRVDVNGKPLLHSMRIYRRVKNLMESLGVSTESWNDKIVISGAEHIFWDDLAYIISLNNENGELRRKITSDLKPLYNFVDDNLINIIVNNKSLFINDSGNKWHSFSLKTMKLLIPELENTSKEQMSALNDLNITRKDSVNYQKKDKIDINHITDNLYNPVVKKSVRHAFKIVNVILKKYKSIENIVVELPRDRNSDEEKKGISKFQKDNFNEKTRAITEFADKLGKNKDELDNFFYKNKKLLTKVRLWYQQEGKCVYSGKEIPAIELLMHSELYEIDHIIPISVSFDDSFSNKVLCLKEMNLKKGNRTPAFLFNDGVGQGYDQMCHMIKNNKRLTKEKKANLETKIDIKDVEIRKRFIGRNLVDTRWSSRVVFNELQDFIKSKGLDMKVSVVRGKFTAKLRKKWKIYKTRDTYYHHAKDAAIIAATPYLSIWKKNNFKMIPKRMGDGVVDIETGEIISENKFNEYVYEEPFNDFIKNVRKLEKIIKIKHTEDTKKNRKLSDSTIYSVRETRMAGDKKFEAYKVDKLNIYDWKGYLKFKALDQNKILMYHHDSKTFEILQRIINDYPEYEEVQEINGKVKRVSISPFELYRRENGKIKKFSKKDNGPEVNQIKYYSEKVNSCIDITPNNANNKRSVLLSLNPWRSDVYFNFAKNNYEVIGLKYNDIVEINGKKGIEKEHYNNLIEKQVGTEKIEFCFSLYRNSIIKVINGNEKIELRFGSSQVQKNKVILKPVDRDLFNPNEIVKVYEKANKKGVIERKFSKSGFIVLKSNIDELGNRYYLRKEDGPKDILYK